MEHAKKSTRQAMRTLQRCAGIGKVFDGDKLLSTVRYTVALTQAIVYAGSQPSAGTTDIKGTLVIVDGERKWKRRTKLTLQMEDGRTAAFVTTGGDARAGTVGVQISELSGRR